MGKISKRTINNYFEFITLKEIKYLRL